MAKLYRENGFRLYLVGGSVRDGLLGRPFTDFDFATDATPEEEKAFLGQDAADYSFEKYGSLRLIGKNAEITTLREEGEYKDHRHPSRVRFVKDPLLDYKRRDFTVNAMYLDENYRLIDYSGGMADLRGKLLRFVGDPDKRVREDPLRILRAYRLAKTLGFEIEKTSLRAIRDNLPLLGGLNPAKIREEERKGYSHEEE